MRDEIGLPGSVRPDEVDRLRRLERGLVADGYEVVQLAFAAGGRPAAVVVESEEVNAPGRRLMVAAREILRAVDELELPRKVNDEELEVSPEDYETIAALRVAVETLTRIAKTTIPRTVGELAHVDLAVAVRRGLEWRK
jgi:hypothetical protein